MQNSERNKIMVQYLPCWFRPVAALTTLVLMCQVIYSPCCQTQSVTGKLSATAIRTTSKRRKIKMKKLRALRRSFTVRSTRRIRWANKEYWEESKNIAIEARWDEIPMPNARRNCRILWHPIHQRKVLRWVL